MSSHRISHFITSVVLVIVGVVAPRLAWSDAKYTIKFAVIAPEGSTWMNVVHELDKDLQAQTNGEVALKIYAGGVAGDEKDVLRKIRIGQINAGGFTGIGLGEIVPEVRALELPLLFNTYEEVDQVAAAIRPDLEKAFQAKGFELLGWAEAGFAHLMSKKPVTKRDDLNGMKLWAWEGDPLVKELYSALGIVPVYLSLPDVMVSLQTDMIDAFYNSALGAVALQWFTKIKYVTEDPLAYASGALVISKKTFDALPANHQKTLRNIVTEKSKKLVTLTRKENQEAVEVLKQNGIQLVKLTPEAKTELQEISRKVHQSMVGKLYPQALLDKVYQLVATMRK